MTIPLIENEEALDESFSAAFAQGVDVVIDYLWGMTAERLLAAAVKTQKNTRPLQFVQVGSASGADSITLPSAILRAAPIEMTGSGLGSVSTDRFVKAIAELLQAAAAGALQIETKSVPLSEVEQAWTSSDSGRRTVFTV